MSHETGQYTTGSNISAKIHLEMNLKKMVLKWKKYTQMLQAKPSALNQQNLPLLQGKDKHRQPHNKAAVIEITAATANTDFSGESPGESMGVGNKNKIIDICQKNNISMIGLFGSTVRGDDIDSSDIDIFVKNSK